MYFVIKMGLIFVGAVAIGIFNFLYWRDVACEKSKWLIAASTLIGLIIFLCVVKVI